MLRRLFGPLVRELAKCVELEWLTLRLQIRIRRFKKAEARHERARALCQSSLVKLRDFIAKDTQAISKASAKGAS